MKPMTDGDLAIETRGLSKRFGDVTAVDALDLSIRRGELFALLGVNGAGKTTTIRMLTTLARPTGGTARVCGYDLLTESREVKRVSGISPQQTAIAQGLTVRENLMLMTRLYGASTAQAEERTDALLSALSLVFFIGVGLLFGALLSQNAAPGLVSVVITLSGVMGGVWMPLEDMPKLERVFSVLPFVHGVRLARGAYRGGAEHFGLHLGVTLAAAVLAAAVAILAMHLARRRETR